ncbi:hypothetical protein [Aeromicrobium sp. NPDC092404]|uniref:hypothetical protein n=1 Tax=Aeromicrobium sp. NPDC092404 TaxID=3154976 RepID=UPI0034192D75
MKRTATVLVTTIVGITTLSACGGGGDPYCDAVDKNKSTLNSFGEQRTDAAYANYAKVLSSIGKDAPASIKKDWTKLSSVTTGVLDAQKKTGLKLEEMADTAKVKKLSDAQLKELNAAYKTFNETADERNAVVKNVKQECKINLK